ncbi:DUF742 domain-containing protein [Pseudonocardia sichuanensis]
MRRSVWRPVDHADPARPPAVALPPAPDRPGSRVRCGGAVSVAQPSRRAGPRRLVPRLAAGGARPAGPELPVETLVSATRRARWGRDLGHEHRAILELARTPVSLVEIGARLAVPVTVARALVRELADGRYLDVHAPPWPGVGGRPTRVVLIRLLTGLRAR